MKEQLISLETAKLAKEKGFNWPVNRFFDEFNDICPTFSSDFNEYVNFNSFKLSAPTQALLQKWLRDVHDVDVLISHQFLQEENTGVLYDFYITTKISNTDSPEYCNHGFDRRYKIYEQALEVGLLEALKLVEDE